MRTYQGLDMSPNHWAIVELDEDGGMTSFVYLTDNKASAQKAPRGQSIYRPRPRVKKDDPDWNCHRFNFERLDANERFLSGLFDRTMPTMIALEDYAQSKERGAHLLGEHQGPIRLAAWRRGIELGLYAPNEVKMYAAHDGTASKEDVIEAVAERWGVDFSKFDDGSKVQTAGDLADAYVLARLALTEDQLRRGCLRLDDLKHEKEVRVFQRATKARPVSRLGQGRLQRETV